MSDGGSAVRDLAFVSYSHAEEDKEWLERFRMLFKPYVRKGRLVFWADPHIRVGERWERKIEEALGRARVGVLLLSPNFAASDFIADTELPALCEAAKQNRLTLFCIPVSSVDAEILELGGYQWARPPNQPLDLLNDAERNRALVEITKTLVELFNAWDEPPGEQLVGVKKSERGERVAAREPVKPLAKRPGADLAELHGVPELPPHFVPRTANLAELKKALLESTVQAHGISAPVKAGLHGQGGIGKTVLASSLCRDDDVRRAFADGVYWLTFGQEPDLIALQRLLLELATGERVELESTTLGTVALRDALGEKNCLLALDDVWQGAHAAAFEVLGSRGRLLVTTRDQEILNALGAETLSLDVLSPDDALGLLANWAKKPRETLPPEASDVARECGYLPLALALAGAQAGAGTSWADLARKLDAGNIEFLDHAHLSVFKSLSLSFRALSPEHAERYRELAIFPEDVAVPESAIVRLWGEAGLATTDARKLLVYLASRALLFLSGTEPEREVRFHDLQGDYLRLIARDVSAAHGRLLDAHYRLLRGDEPGPTRWASLSTEEAYLWRHLLHHLSGAERRDEAEAVVGDKRWLAAKIAATGVSALLADLASFVERAPGGGSERIERALRFEAGWLHQQPDALEGLLYNRLRAEDLSAEEIARLLPGLHPRVRLAHPVNFGGGRVFRGHSGAVTSCVYSSDGQRLLSASEDGTLREWDRASGKEIQRFEGHFGRVTSSAYSPDGQRVLSASDDGTLREWDRASGREVRRFEGHSRGVTACAYSPDGQRVLSASYDKTLREWERASGREVRLFAGHSNWVMACAYSPDGQRVLSASGDTTLREWDRVSGKEVRQFEGHSDWVKGCAYSPDGQRVLSASDDTTLREWDRVSGKEVRRFEGHSDWVTACAYSPDSQRVLSASNDKTLREWERASSKEVRRFEGHSSWVKACAYSPDGQRVLSASYDQTLREWERASGKEVRRFEGHSRGVTACAYSPDGQRVLSASYDKTFREWERASGKEVRRFEGHSRGVTACAYSPDGQRVLSASSDKTLREWDRASGKEVRRFEGHADWATACAYSPDGQRVLSASSDKTLREWDCASGKEARRFEGHSDWVRACAYSPDGQRVLSASDDRRLREWERASGKEVRRFEGHSAWVMACAYSPDGQRVLSASSDETLREWDRASGKEVRLFEGHSGGMTACAYSSDGQRMVSASLDNTIRIWSTADARLLSTIHGGSAFFCVACIHGHIAAGDALGNVWMLEHDWF